MRRAAVLEGRDSCGSVEAAPRVIDELVIPTTCRIADRMKFQQAIAGAEASNTVEMKEVGERAA
jgi:hypothetical protein